jgi:glycosyltransferase involved in cell wall biosynthesis
VMEALSRSSLAERYELAEVETHQDGGAAVKAATAAAGFASVAVALARRRPDLVYLHSASGASFWRKAIVAGMATIARRPYVMHVHGGAFLSFHAAASRPARAVIRRVLRGAAAVVTLTPRWAEGIGAIAGRPTETIPNPVTMPGTAADATRRPARVLTLGRLGPEKGSPVLVAAFAMIADRHPGTALVMAGDGDPAEVARLAAEGRVTDRVRLPGWVGPEARDALLLDASVFTLPSRVEGLPMGMLEAMSFGLPVVMTPVGGIPDLIVDGVNGRLVPVDDAPALARALDELLSDPEAARRMGEEGRRTVAGTCAIEMVAARVGEVIERAIAEGAARPRRARAPLRRG